MKSERIAQKQGTRMRDEERRIQRDIRYFKVIATLMAELFPELNSKNADNEYINKTYAELLDVIRSALRNEETGEESPTVNINMRLADDKIPEDFFEISFSMRRIDPDEDDDLNDLDELDDIDDLLNDDENPFDMN